MATMYPSGYGTTMVTLTQLKAQHLNHMHPVFAERLFEWLEAQGGKFGIGGGFRETQPVKPGFAPAGKSFHQAQQFASGFVGYCAVDLVVAVPGAKHRAPTWAEVPAQGTAAAKKAGVHCNVGAPGQTGSEPWHMQPVEIDGYDTWVDDGRPDPTEPAPPPPPTPTPEPTPPTPTEEDDLMQRFIRPAGSQAIYACFPGRKVWLVDYAAYQMRRSLNDLEGHPERNELTENANPTLMKATYPVEGPVPGGHDAWGSPT